jgi:hypothetical protein
MPYLEEYFNWDHYEIIGKGKSFGTMDMKSIFQTAIRFLGWEKLSIDPPSLHSITLGFWYWNILNCIRSPVRLEYFVVGDDYGSNNGLLISPEMWRNIVKPELRDLIETGKKKDMQIVMHSDGDVSALLDDFVELGVDYLHPCQTVGGMPKEDVTNYKGMTLLREDNTLEYRGYPPVGEYNV